MHTKSQIFSRYFLLAEVKFGLFHVFFGISVIAMEFCVNVTTKQHLRPVISSNIKLPILKAYDTVQTLFKGTVSLGLIILY